jgi:hypothetical protein
MDMKDREGRLCRGKRIAQDLQLELAAHEAIVPCARQPTGQCGGGRRIGVSGSRERHD